MAKKSTGNKLSGMISTGDCPTPYKQSAAEKAERRKWEAQDALRTITRAEEIKRDRALMSEVKKCAREQVKSLECVTKRK